MRSGTRCSLWLSDPSAIWYVSNACILLKQKRKACAKMGKVKTRKRARGRHRVKPTGLESATDASKEQLDVDVADHMLPLLEKVSHVTSSCRQLWRHRCVFQVVQSIGWLQGMCMCLLGQSSVGLPYSATHAKAWYCEEAWLNVGGWECRSAAWSCWMSEVFCTTTDIEGEYSPSDSHPVHLIIEILLLEATKFVQML